MATKRLAERIEEMVAPAAAELGFAIVRVVVRGEHRSTLQVMAERSDGRVMSVDDCAGLSRQLSALLDVEDPITGAYTLEVSSPGIDRPLVRLADFARFAGRDARVEVRRPIGGRRRFRGRLVGVVADAVRIAVDDGAVVDLPHVDIERAQLVLTEELLKSAKEGVLP